MLCNGWNSSFGSVTFLSSLETSFTVTVPFFIQEYRWVLINCCGILTIQRETCDWISLHPRVFVMLHRLENSAIMQNWHTEFPFPELFFPSRSGEWRIFSNFSLTILQSPPSLMLQPLRVTSFELLPTVSPLNETFKSWE